VLREGTAILQQNSEKSERVEVMLRSVAEQMKNVDECLKRNKEHIDSAEKVLREVEKQIEISRAIKDRR